MLGSRVARTWRGVIAAGAATLIAAVSHSLADGMPAPAIGVVLALVVAVPACVALAGRRLSWWRLAIAVTVSQFALHGLLLIGVTDPSGPAATVTGHAHDAASLATALAPTSAPHATHAGAGMWLGHAIAALLTVLAIGQGERALRALLALVWGVAIRMLEWRPSTPPRRRPFEAPLAVPALRSRFLLSAVWRRGPPVTA